VLSTLHTNDSTGAVTRLIDMGVEPFLIASTLEAVLAQRLIRRVCTQCRAAFMPEASLLRQVGVNPEDVGGKAFSFGQGCALCNQSGYKGRLGIFEFLRITDQQRELIMKRSPAIVLRQKALEEGMRTLRESGLRGIFNGLTTIEEVIKYT
jgi:type IV pilus assembly protein PilB